jgi:hypothetical protein
MSASNPQVHSGSSSAVFLVQSVISRNWWVQNIPWYNTPERDSEGASVILLLSRRAAAFSMAFQGHMPGHAQRAVHHDAAMAEPWRPMPLHLGNRVVYAKVNAMQACALVSLDLYWTGSAPLNAITRNRYPSASKHVMPTCVLSS